MSKHILIVDDSASIRQMVEMTLKSAAYQVTTANDGQAGLDPVSYTHLTLPTSDLV